MLLNFKGIDIMFCRGTEIRPLKFIEVCPACFKNTWGLYSSLRGLRYKCNGSEEECPDIEDIHCAPTDSVASYFEFMQCIIRKAHTNPSSQETASRLSLKDTRSLHTSRGSRPSFLPEFSRMSLLYNRKI